MIQYGIVVLFYYGTILINSHICVGAHISFPTLTHDKQYIVVR